MEKLLSSTMTIEFHNLPEREMEIFKSCFINMLEVKNKIVFPGQIIINLDELGIVKNIWVKGKVWNRRKT